MDALGAGAVGPQLLGLLLMLDGASTVTKVLQ